MQNNAIFSQNRESFQIFTENEGISSKSLEIR